MGNRVTEKGEAGVTCKKEPGGNRPNEEDEDLPIDRGWAWLVLGGCFLNAVFIVGYNRSLSLFFVEFLDIFNASTAATTMIMGAKSLSYSLSALVTMHVLLEFLGTQRTVMLGGTIFSLSILASSFAPNIAVLIFLHICLGVGHSMIHSPGLVMISKYFKKRRSLATTTASSAISFSSGVFPLLSEYLLNEYGIRGAMLICSALTMHIIVGGSLYLPLEFFKRQPIKYKDSKDENEPMIKDAEGADVKVTPVRNDSEKNGIKPRAFNGKLESNNDVCLSRSVEIISSDHLSDDHYEIRNRTFSEGASYHHLRKPKSKSHNNIFASDLDFMAASVIDLQESSKEAPNVSKKDKKKSFSKQFRKIIKAFDFSLFKKPLFLLISCFSFMGIMLRLGQIYLPARVHELGMTQSDAAILLLITGILDFFCRIFYGFLADLRILKVHHIMAIGLIVTGTMAQFMTYFTTFPLLIVYSVITGIFGSAYQCLIPVAITELLGQEYLAKTLGFVALYQGAATGIGHPIIGGIRDLTGSYVGSYHFLGASSLVASGLLLLEPLVRKYDKNTKMNNGP